MRWMDRNGNDVKNSLCGVETKQKSGPPRMGYNLTLPAELFKPNIKGYNKVDCV